MAGNQKIKIIICDDHVMFSEGIRSLIEHENIGQIIAEVRNGKELLIQLEKSLPDLVLMDIEMPVMNGVDATREAMLKYPELKILVLSMFGNEQYYREMIQAGVKGFVLKSSDIEELERAVRNVSAGKEYFSNQLLVNILSKINTPNSNFSVKNFEIPNFSQREMQVLSYVCSGLSTIEIADKVSLSTKTIDSYRARLLSKTETKNVVGLVLYAIKNNLIEL